MTAETEKKFEAILVPEEATVRETLKTIASAGKHGAPIGIALVTNQDRLLLGVVTDGDVRRAVVEGVDLEGPVSRIMTRTPITVGAGLNPSEMLKEMTEKVRRSAHIRDSKVEFLIVTDEAGRVVDVVNTFDLLLRVDITNWTVAVAGLGFVGLTLGVSLAESGYDVHGVEIDPEIAESIAAGRPHFHELGLEPLLNHHLSRSTFSVHTELPAGVDIYVIAVGTPVDTEGIPSLDNLRSATVQVSERLKRNDLVVVRSTVPVGTTRNLILPVLEEGSGLTCGQDFYLAFAPERTVEGSALRELRTLPQIVGGFDPRSVDLGAQFFGKLAPNIVRVNSLEAAEFAKLINNSFRDLSFAFANELAMVCEAWDVDAVKVIEAANSGYPRDPIPVPSPGVGGFCLTKDPYIYAWAGIEKGLNPKLSLYGRQVNQSIVKRVTDRVLEFLLNNGRKAEDCKVFVIGFAFKGHPDTSDMRHSTSLEIVASLQAHGFDLHGYDPVVDPVELAETGVKVVGLKEGFEGADAALVLNNHRSYSDLDLYDLLPRMRTPGLFFDGWHIFDRRDVDQIEGIEYEGLSGAH